MDFIIDTHGVGTDGQFTYWRAGHLIIKSSPKKLCRYLNNSEKKILDGVAIEVWYGQQSMAEFHSESQFAGFLMDDLLRMFKEYCKNGIDKDKVGRVVEATATAYDFWDGWAAITGGVINDMYETVYIDITRIRDRRRHYGELIPLV